MARQARSVPVFKTGLGFVTLIGTQFNRRSAWHSAVLADAGCVGENTLNGVMLGCVSRP
jgi:hypothetical protein